MSDLRRKEKGRKERGTFLLILHDIMDHPNFVGLSPRATKLLIDLARQFNGSNNGDLTTAWKTMSQVRGWTSKDQLYKARDELLCKGWIVQTRKGRRPNIANLYALTWHPIHECGGKLERSPTRQALGYWKQSANPEHHSKLKRDARHTGHRRPPHGSQKLHSVPLDSRHTGHREQKVTNLTPATRAPSKIYTKHGGDSEIEPTEMAVSVSLASEGSP